MNKKAKKTASQVKLENAARRIAEFISEELLDMPCPRILFQRTEYFATPTTAAVTTGLKGGAAPCIYFDPAYLSHPLALFFLAHELRHCWQADNMPEFEHWLSTYKLSDKTDTLDDYNLQPMEIDAHAFAQIASYVILHRYTELQSFSREVCCAIEKRRQQILEEEFDTTILE